MGDKRLNLKVVLNPFSWTTILVFFATTMGLLLFGQMVINKVEQVEKKRILEELQLTLNANVSILNFWFQEKMKTSRVISEDPFIKKNLLAILQKSQSTDGSFHQLSRIPELHKLRNAITDELTEAGFLGFVLFEPEGLQVGTLFDDALGKKQLIKLSDFFQNSLTGKVVFSLPFLGEIPLPDEEGVVRPNQPTMFISIPIKDGRGQILGVLAFRLNPAKEFSQIFKINRTRRTGEIYAFSRAGKMISDSRFNKQLRQIGLIPDKPWSTSVLQIEIRDPGGNMIEGFRPIKEKTLWPLTLMASQAVQGISGFNLDGYNDYRGVPVVGVWTWLPEFGFGITSEIDVAEAFEPIQILNFWFWILFSLSLFIFSGLIIVYWRKQVSNVREQATQLRFKTIVDNAFSGILSINQQGQIQTLNREAERIFGYTEKELAGKSINLLVPKSYRSDHDKHIENLFSDERTEIFNVEREVMGLRKDGSTFPLNIVVSEILTEDEHLFIGQFNDISERKKTEAIIKKEARYTHLNQIVTKIISECAIVEDAFQATLDAVCETTGWPVGHVYKNSENCPNTLVPTKIWHLKDPIAFKNFVKITEGTEFESGIGLPGRVLALKKAAWIFNVQEDDNFPRARQALEIEAKGAFGFPIMIKDEVVGVMEFFSLKTVKPDTKFLNVMFEIGIRLGRVVERSRAENKLMHAKKVAERANIAKSEFLSQMSHELKTPMHAIMGFSQLMLHETKDKLTSDQKDNLKEIHNAADHLLTLINEVLELSKTLDGRISLTPENMDLTSLVNEVLLDTKALTANLNIQIINEIPKTGLTLRADRYRLSQVLTNLLTNAIKYNRENGSVRISCEKDTDKPFKIHIKDTGLGIAEENMDKLFQPFERLGAERTGISGTGIGLALSLKLVRLMNGDLVVDSQVNSGSCFTIELPISLCEAN